jgi:hypothetical protein
VGIFGLFANTEIKRVWQKVATTHGAIPYIMPIAIMYASPMLIVVLAESMEILRETEMMTRARNNSQPGL